MLPLALIAVLLSCTYGQTAIEKDPTKVCFPDTLQFVTFNLNTDEGGIEAVDFKRNLLGSVTPSRTLVQDYNARKTYLLSADGNCQVFDIPEDTIFTKCLPARAVFVGEANWGFGPNLLPEDGWQFSYNGGELRVLVTKQPGQPRYIMMSKFVEANGNYTVTMYLNPSVTITQANIFDVPKQCASKCPPSIEL
ncbi:hypothetical protein Bpfe_019971 [Biomphalaria pfeifferi]|uniref:Uncharacterized protein n=1 Tax=Biomphalaria pfeifferi TaxID=112525 RepID=A0AAD8BB25_BIOPF|nr:hypothetical protein Bpfe_019971 [Biomphalaria pfeifferi]